MSFHLRLIAATFSLVLLHTEMCAQIYKYYLQNPFLLFVCMVAALISLHWITNQGAQPSLTLIFPHSTVINCL